MSIENLLSKGELAKQVEEYISRRIKGEPVDTSQAPSGCVVQIYKSHPCKLSDGVNCVDVSDPAAINDKLKAVMKNANWNTMRGAIIVLRKWRFNSSYDTIREKLRLNIIVEEIDYMQGGGVSDQSVMVEVPSLVDEPHLKNKFNRLQKFHLAEEFNTYHPIEEELDLVDKERAKRSDVARLMDASVKKGPTTNEPQEANQNQYFWTYEFTQEVENQGEPSQPALFPTESRNVAVEEEAFEDLLQEFAQDALEKKSPCKTLMEVEEYEEIVTSKTKDQPPVVTHKRKFHEFVSNRKSQGDEAEGSKKSSKGLGLDNVGEQQKFIKQREGKKSATITQTLEVDTLDLLETTQPQRVQRKPSPAAPVPEPKKSIKKGAKPLIAKMLKQPEEIEPEDELDMGDDFVLIGDNSKGRIDRRPEKVSKPVAPRQTGSGGKKYVAPKKPVQYDEEEDEDELFEISNKDYMKSFKLIKFSPSKGQSKSATKDIVPEKKKQTQRRSLDAYGDDDDDEGYEEIFHQQKKVKVSPVKLAENPLNKKSVINLDEFKPIQFKSATSTTGSFIRGKNDNVRRSSHY